MSSGRGLAGALVTLALFGCGPEAGDDTYPNNCGVEGPVDLFGVFPRAWYFDVQRAGDYYLIDHSWDGEHIETYSVDRCGRERVLLHRARLGALTRLGAAGDHALSCNEDTGEITYVDPTGVKPPHPVFPSVGGCRVVPLGQGLAAQQREGGTVWFHPDPTDPGVEPIVVTDSARIANPAWEQCSPRFDCDVAHPLGLSITAAGDDLLMVLQSEQLLAFSSSARASRILDEGPVQAIGVLPDEDLVVVQRMLGPHLVVERQTGESFEFCCHDDIEPIRRLGDWLVKGSLESPIIPEPPEWTNFRALHLPSGTYTEVSGTDAWRTLARLDTDTIVVDISPPWRPEEGGRYVVRPATGERQRVELPGEHAWAVPGTDGMFTAESTETAHALHHLAGPDQEPRTLQRNVTIAFPTVEGRIVFARGVRVDHYEGLPLAVMLPDERIVELEEHVVMTMGPAPWDEHWVVDANEVLYVAEDDDGHWMLKRTVLP